MMGFVDVFAELDRCISGTVRFVDGSNFKIHSQATVVFAVKGGDHKAFTDVFYIPALKSSVVSLGQLDENWYDITIRCGVLTVCDQLSRLLFKVKRSLNCLYRLSFRPVQLMCLAVGPCLRRLALARSAQAPTF